MSEDENNKERSVADIMRSAHKEGQISRSDFKRLDSLANQPSVLKIGPVVPLYSPEYGKQRGILYETDITQNDIKELLARIKVLDTQFETNKKEFSRKREQRKSQQKVVPPELTKLTRSIVPGIVASATELSVGSASETMFHRPKKHREVALSTDREYLEYAESYNEKHPTTHFEISDDLYSAYFRFTKLTESGHVHIKFSPFTTEDGSEYVLVEQLSLTPRGNEYLKSLRADSFWGRTKQRIETVVIAAVTAAVIAIGTSYFGKDPESTPPPTGAANPEIVHPSMPSTGPEIPPDPQ